MMRVQLLNLMSVAAAWVGTLKLCCVLPGALALVGLAGTAAAEVVRWLAPGLFMVSAGSLGWSFWRLYGVGRGSTLSRRLTWVSAIASAAFWGYRLLAG